MKHVFMIEDYKVNKPELWDKVSWKHSWLTMQEDHTLKSKKLNKNRRAGGFKLHSVQDIIMCNITKLYFLYLPNTKK